MNCPDCQHEHVLELIIDKHRVSAEDLEALIHRFNNLSRISHPSVRGKDLACWLARTIIGRDAIAPKG